MLKRSLTLALLALLVIPALVMAGDLDGTTWLGKEGKLPVGKKDKMVFQNGNFTSVECAPYGFKEGPYESKKAGNAVSWTATQKNDKGETMAWQGSWDGKSKYMTGSYIWTQANGKTETKNWKAKKAS